MYLYYFYHDISVLQHCIGSIYVHHLEVQMLVRDLAYPHAQVQYIHV